MLRQGLFEHQRRDTFVVSADATPAAVTGAGTGLPPAPEGYAWYLENLAWAVLGNSHTAIADFAVSADNGKLPAQAAWDHAGMFDTFAAAVRGSRNYPNPILIPPGHFLVAFFSAGTLAQNDQVTVSVQIAVHQLDPRELMSPQDVKAVRASKEHPSSPLTETAVAGAKAV